MLIILKTPFFDSPIFYIGLLIFAGVMLYNFYFSKKAIVKRKLKKAEGKNMFELQDGDIAKITGTIAYFGKTLIAPLSGRKCSYYYVLVEECRSSGKSSHWHNLIEEEVAGSVVIKDGNNYAIILTSLVHSYVVEDEKFTSGFLKDATEVLENYLKKHGHKSTGLLGFNDTLRYKEGVLEEGETVAVVGKAKWIKKSETNLKIPAERILVIGPDNEVPVFFSDDPDATQ